MAIEKSSDLSKKLEQLGIWDKQIYFAIPKGEKFGVKRFCNELKEYCHRLGYSVVFDEKTAFQIFWILIFRKNAVVFLNLHFLLLSILPARSTKIALLHGFPTFKSYSFPSFFRVGLAHWLASCADLVISNSHLTQLVNEHFFAVKSSVVWNPILSRELERPVEIEPVNEVLGSKPCLLFVGRMSEAKGVDLIISAVQNVRSHFDRVTFIGPGGDDKVVSFRSADIDYRGYQTEDEISHQYRSHQVFISVNPLEPYGLVYQDAYRHGLRIVLPEYAGIAPYLQDNNRVFKLRDISTESISNALIKVASIK